MPSKQKNTTGPISNKNDRKTPFSSKQAINDSIVLMVLLIISIVANSQFNLLEKLAVTNATADSGINTEALFIILLISICSSLFFLRRWLEIKKTKQYTESNTGKLLEHLEDLHSENLKIIEQSNVFQSLYTNSLDCVAILDDDFKYYRANSAYLQLLHLHENEIIGTDHFDIFPAETKELFQNVLETGRPFKAYGSTFLNLNARVKNPLYWDWSLVPIQSSNHGEPFLVFTLRNVTESKKLYESIHNSRQKLLLQVEQSPVGIIEWDTNFCVVEWNPAAEKIFGYTRSEVIGKHASALVVPESARGHVDKIWNKLLKGKGGEDSKNINYRKDGTEITCHWRNTRIKDIDENIISVISIVEDITEKIRIEKYSQVQKEHSASLLRLTNKLERAEIIDDVVQAALDEIEKIIGFKTVWLYSIPPDFKIAECKGFASNYKLKLHPRFAKINIREDLKITNPSLTEEIRIIEDAQNDSSPTSEIYKTAGCRTVINIPLITVDKKVGMFAAASFGRQGILIPDEQQIGYLRKLAEHITLAYVRVSLQIDRKKALVSLKESEEKYRNLVDQSGDAIYLLKNGTYELVNKRFTELLGLTLEEMQQPDFDILRFVAPRSKELIRDRIKKVRNGEKVTNIYEYTAITKDWREIEVEASVTHVQVNNEMLTQGILRDITKRKKTEDVQTALYRISEASNLNQNLEELLLEIHQILHGVMDATNLYVALYDPAEDSYSFPYLVDQKVDYDGIPVSLKGSYTDFVRRTDTAYIINDEVYQQLAKDNHITPIGTRSKVWMGVPLKTVHGVIGVVALQSYTNSKLYTQDDLEVLSLISDQIAIAIERKQNEKAISDNNIFMKTILDSFANPLYVINAHDYSIEIANEAARKKRYSNVLTNHCYQYNNYDAPCSQHNQECPLQTIMELKHPVKVEHTVYLEDGSMEMYEVHGYPIFDTQGEVKQIIEYLIDITDRKHVENKLSELAVFPEVNPNIVLSINAQQDILYMNSATEVKMKEFGLSIDEIHKCFPQNIDTLFHNLINKEDSIQDVISVISERTLSWTFHLVEGQDIIHCYAIDITEQTKQAHKLSLLSAVASQSSNLVVITDTFGTIEYVNPYFTLITGYESNEVVGKQTSILRSGRMKDSFYKNMWETITKGETWVGKLANLKKNGETYWEHKTISPIISDEGQIKSYVSIANDITNELNTQRKLVEAEKLSAVGTLAAGVAHEFKNYLGGIIGNASFTLDELDNEDGLEIARETLSKIITMGDKANDVAMSLLTFSKAKPEDRKEEDLKKIIQQSIKLVEKELETHSIEMVTHFEDVQPIEISRSKIQQLLLNLFINAKHAIGSNGVITVALMKNHDSIDIKVADSGGGIAEDNLNKIFDPFFSTKGVWGKDEVSGTGMGLSICRNIAREHQGDLRCESIKGIGTTFTLTLPLSQSQEQIILPFSSNEDSSVLLFTLDKSIVSTYYQKICDYKMNLLLVDDFSKIDTALLKVVKFAVCDAKFSAKMELYRMVDFCLQHNLPYCMVNCGTMEYQLSDLFETSVANYKELPTFERIIQHLQSKSEINK